MPSPHHISHILRPYGDRLKFQVRYYKERGQDFMAVEGTLYHKDHVVSRVEEKAWVDLGTLATSEQLRILGQLRDNVIKMYQNSDLIQVEANSPDPYGKPKLIIPEDIGTANLLKAGKLRLHLIPVDPQPVLDSRGSWVWPPDSDEYSGVTWKDDYSTLMIDRAPVRPGEIIGFKEWLYMSYAQQPVLSYRIDREVVPGGPYPQFKGGDLVASKDAPDESVRLKALVLGVRCEKLRRLTEADVTKMGYVPCADITYRKSALGRYIENWNIKYPNLKWDKDPWCWWLDLEPIE